jgi:hypothetical protein
MSCVGKDERILGFEFCDEGFQLLMVIVEVDDGYIGIGQGVQG